VANGLVPGSLRVQLALAIALVTILAVGASFIALYQGTSARLQAQIDSQLRIQVAEWHQLTASSDLSTPAALTSTAQEFIRGQRYHAESLFIVIQAPGMPTVSSNADLLAAEEVRERSEPEVAGLLDSRTGLMTASVAEAGSMRVLTTPIERRGRRVGTLRVANPLTPVERAQASLRQTFVIVGGAALVLAITAGIALATLIAAPLRRMARLAGTAAAGDLTVRATSVRRRGEVGALAQAFDHMLDRLERAFRRQRDFVSDASHELRTPMAVLRAQVELLDRETDEQRRHEGTRTLLRRLDQLDRLVGDMLTLAGADAGHLIEPRTIELGGFFEDLRRDMPLFGQRDFKLEAVEGTLQADPGRLTQVLGNLLRNAVTHTNPGDSICVAAHDRGGWLEITVSDAGPGIASEELERVFERFHRIDGGRSRDTGGSGLGLAIARAIVEAHGGSIHTESPPGRGATFGFELPGYSPGASANGGRPPRPADLSPSGRRKTTDIWPVA
jgi:two-component system, OmpR family, sensor kinase